MPYFDPVNPTITVKTKWQTLTIETNYDSSLEDWQKIFTLILNFLTFEWWQELLVSDEEKQKIMDELIPETEWD